MAEKQMGLLEPVDLREFWEDEAQDFTPWLSEDENLAILSASLGLDLELEDTEAAVGPYKADILAKDAVSDSKVIIENQLDKTNHDHLGKTLTYASGLDADIIIWIAREFTDEHRQAVDFLNEKASPDLRCFAVEVQLWKIGDSLPAPQFKIVASPNEYRAQVVVGPKKLSETRALYLEFWTTFKEYCSNAKTFLGLRKPRHQHWFSIAVGRAKFHISLTASRQKKRIGCEIYMRGASATKAFNLLRGDKEAIEDQLGALNWMELPDGQDCRIVKYKEGMDIGDRHAWDGVFAWLKEQAEQFHSTFSPRIKALPNLDEVGDEEEQT